MISGCNRLICAASLAALVHIVGMPTARAGIVLTISDDAGNTFMHEYDAQSASVFRPVGDFSVFVSARSNFGSSDSGNTGYLTSFNSTVKNNGTATGSLHITVSEAGFTLPSAVLPNFEYLNSAVVTSGGIGTSDGTAQFTSYLHQTGSADVTTGIQNVTKNTNAISVLFPRIAQSYDLWNTTVVTLAGGKGRDVSGSTSVTLSQQDGYTPLQVVPEPASIVALLSSLPLVAAGLYLRRRKLVA